MLYAKFEEHERSVTTRRKVPYVGSEVTNLIERSKFRVERSNHGAIKPDTVSNVARAQLKSANSASFSAVISIAFGKKVSLTPELIL